MFRFDTPPKCALLRWFKAILGYNVHLSITEKNIHKISLKREALHHP